MTDQHQARKPKLEKIENLELNKETLQDLTESESQAAVGGLELEPSMRLERTCWCINTQGCPVPPPESAKCTRDTCGCITYHCQ